MTDRQERDRIEELQVATDKLLELGFGYAASLLASACEDVLEDHPDIVLAFVIGDYQVNYRPLPDMTPQEAAVMAGVAVGWTSMRSPRDRWNSTLAIPHRMLRHFEFIHSGRILGIHELPEDPSPTMMFTDAQIPPSGTISIDITGTPNAEFDVPRTTQEELQRYWDEPEP